MMIASAVAFGPHRRRLADGVCPPAARPTPGQTTIDMLPSLAAGEAAATAANPFLFCRP